MKKYTREQLIEAHQKWNKEVLKNPEKFEGDYKPDLEFATEQTDCLLSHVE